MEWKASPIWERWIEKDHLLEWIAYGDHLNHLPLMLDIDGDKGERAHFTINRIICRY